MKITHVESGTVIANDAKKATSYWQRFRGLMLRKRLNPGEALVIEPCSSIHMMFMLFAIDAAQKLGAYGENAEVCLMGENGHFHTEWVTGGRAPVDAARA